MSLPSHALAEIQQLVEAALARHGTAGTVQVNGDQIVLSGSGPSVSTHIAHLLVEWQQLPFPERQRKCSGVARDLSRQRRPVPAARPSRPRRSFGLLVVAGLGLGAAALYWKSEARLQPSARAAPAPAMSVLERAEQERRERAARVCNATRTRIARGATVGPTDAEGWVVELALARDGPRTAWESLVGFVSDAETPAGGRVAWAGAPELSDLVGAGTRVAVHERHWPGSTRSFDELVLTFSGEYVLSYFRERERIRLIRFAHALAEHEQASLGALYGRCADGTAHHMGAWFLGTSPGAATAALLYYMGAHSEPAHLAPELLSEQPAEALVPAFALATLLDMTRRFDRQKVAALIGADDGMVAGPAHFTTLGFPFVDSDRAWRASFKIARGLAAR